MIVLYGTQGSGAAAVEAALDIAGLSYRGVDAAIHEALTRIEANPVVARVFSRHWPPKS